VRVCVRCDEYDTSQTELTVVECVSHTQPVAVDWRKSELTAVSRVLRADISFQQKKLEKVSPPPPTSTTPQPT
jgi:hypothetical protein